MNVCSVTWSHESCRNYCTSSQYAVLLVLRTNWKNTRSLCTCPIPCTSDLVKRQSGWMNRRAASSCVCLFIYAEPKASQETMRIVDLSYEHWRGHFCRRTYESQSLSQGLPIRSYYIDIFAFTQPSDLMMTWHHFKHFHVRKSPCQQSICPRPVSVYPGPFCSLFDWRNWVCITMADHVIISP